MKNIELKASTLVNGGFVNAIILLQQSKMPIMLTKRFKQIMTHVSKEQKDYIDDTAEVRKEIFGEDKEDILKLILVMGTEKEKETLAKHFEGKPEEETTFRENYKKLNDHCEETGKIVVTIPFPKMKFPDSFEFPYNSALALSDIIELEE